MRSRRQCRPLWGRKSLWWGRRTDAGVHASDFTAHFDSDSRCLTEGPAHVIYKINAILPKNIVLRDIVRVRDDAHARFDADSRTYRYYIHGRKDPILWTWRP